MVLCAKILLSVSYTHLDVYKRQDYHSILISTALLSSLLYTVLNYQWPHQFTFLIITPLLYQHLRRVNKNTFPEKLDKELKRLALITLLFSFTFGIGLIRI